MPSLPHRFSFTTLLLVLLQLMQLQNVFAQAPLVKMWDYRYGGTWEEKLYSFCQTSDGGYVLGGPSSSDSSGDKTQNSWGSSDFWMVKIDSLGFKQWDKRFGGFATDFLTSLIQTDDGGYLLGGSSMSYIGGDKTQNTFGDNDYWIIKLDSHGNKQWDKDYGGSSGDELHFIQQTSDGGFILGGISASNISGNKSQNTWGQYDFWIVKVDSVGNKQWDKDYGGTNGDALLCLQQTFDGGYILGGFSLSGISGDKTQNNWGLSDYWILKIDSIGNKQWDKDFGGSDYDELLSLVQTTDSGYIFAGRSMSGISGDKSQNSWGGFDYWIVKTDSLGTKQWDRDFGGVNNEDDFGNIVQDLKGGYIMSGTSYSPIGGDKTEANIGIEQSWIIKINSNGYKQWDKTVFSPGHDEASLVIRSNDGFIVVACQSNGMTGGYKSQPNWDTTSFTNDLWIIKFYDSAYFFSPIINLSTSDTTFCEKSCINFFDLSTNNPTSWQWNFPGASPDTSTLQNPTNICYNTYGTYDVTLVACNQFGCDSITFSNFITCYQNPVDSIWGSNDTLWSTVAVGYQWYETTSGIISGAINQYYVPVQLGSYFCVVTDSNGCEAVSNTIVLTAVPPLSFGEGPGVRPNPATDFISVDFPFSTNQQLFLEIFDVNGNIVIHQLIDDKNKINISSLAKGVYGYRIISNDKILQQGKLVKM